MRWTTGQLNTGLQERNVEMYMEAIKKLKELGANVTFSLAAGEGQDQPGYPQYAQEEAAHYPGNQPFASQ